MSSCIVNGLIEFLPGDDVSITVTLKKEDVQGVESSFNIDVGATVTANMYKGSNKLIASSVTCLSGATGADWANSIVVVDFADTDTTGLTEQSGVGLSIRVDDGQINSWLIPDIIRIHPLVI